MGTLRELTALLAGRTTTPASGGQGWTLRLLSAYEVLQARREAGELAQEERERALCSNACLLARALEKNGEAVFPSGAAVLEALQVGDIARLAEEWSRFNEAQNPSPEDGEERIEGLKKAWSTRPMSALSGACSRALAFFRPRPRRGR